VSQRAFEFVGLDLFAEIEGGQLVPSIEQTYPLSEMPNAMRHLKAGRARGKLVIAVSST
jgi:NADPH:quinone reductase-like Zn-dependent oxidoreductase